ncbi:methyltransferase domain-containing protein [Massilia varians]|uniref:methyltransferase domain-containing protein n=1 Tax=Massilia varians TaxID=457921 RepID=UPI002557AD61|nr:class I SAM-dependent methyltransferase [Massilia varians]
MPDQLPSPSHEALSTPASPMRRRVTCGTAALAGASLAPALLLPPHAAAARLPVVPYVSTPPDVVRRMLALGRVGRDDTVYDLGCGDGRIVIEAARRHGARGVGIDLDPERIREAREHARRAGVERRVRFQQADLFATDFSPATVVMLYLLFEVNLKLMPQLWRHLRPGSRVVSHDFHMGGQWPPEQIVRIGKHSLYAWTITPDLRAYVAGQP